MSTIAVNAITDASGGNTASINGATPTNDNLMGRNKVINGNFDIWQRGTSFTLSAGAQYTADRFNVGGATGSVTRQAFTVGQTDVPGNPTYFARWAMTSNSQNYEFTQKVEDVRNLAGEQATLSFYAKRNSGSTTVGVRLVQDFGTGGSPSGLVVTSVGTPSLTSSWQKFTYTVSIPSISGKTLGTNNNSSLWVSIQVADTNTGEIDIAQMQLEAGSVATSFERVDYGEMLRRCQRYYFKFNNSAGSAWANNNFTASGFRFPVTMRAQPSIDAGATFSVNAGVAGTVAVYTGSPTGTDGNSIWVYNSASNWTVGAVVALNAGFSAEL